MPPSPDANPEVRIRSFRSDDLPLLREMTVEAFQGVSIDENMEKIFGVINGRDWKWRKGRHVDADAARDPEGIFVLEVGGETAGYISTWQDREAGIGHIPNLVLGPQYRGRGFGRRLLEFALERFRNSGLSHAKIETLTQNPVGMHLYESVGFKEIARQVHFVAELNSQFDTIDLLEPPTLYGEAP